MPSRVICFWLEPTDQAEISLRRYRSSTNDTNKCTLEIVPYPGHPAVVYGYHNAEVKIERRPRGVNDSGHHPTVDEQADPRWPKKCGCGYEFAPTDVWQLNSHTLYKRLGTNELYTLSDAPVGAMYDAFWYRAEGDPRQPDGKNLVLKTPAGDWHIDGPASNGPGWQRTGTPPNISCTPSISIGQPQQLHGWLHNGVLEIDFP